MKIEKIDGGRGLISRLTDMGLHPGLKVKVINNTGAFILQVGETRLAIGRGIAHNIMVSPVMDKDYHPPFSKGQCPS